MDNKMMKKILHGDYKASKSINRKGRQELTQSSQRERD
jgi:hypothetical protein